MTAYQEWCAVIYKTGRKAGDKGYVAVFTICIIRSTYAGICDDRDHQLCGFAPAEGHSGGKPAGTIQQCIGDHQCQCGTGGNRHVCLVPVLHICAAAPDVYLLYCHNDSNPQWTFRRRHVCGINFY